MTIEKSAIEYAPLAGPVTNAAVARVLSDHPDLHMLGYGNLFQRRQRFTPEQIADYRKQLVEAGSVERIGAACGWIERTLRKCGYINHTHTSYGLKHAAEPFIGYLTNGQFIAAMILCGYRAGAPVQYNPSFDVSNASVKGAWAEARRKQIRGEGVAA